MSKHLKKIIFSAIGLLMLSSLVLADDDRSITVDRAVGGMEQGSRIAAPGTTPVPITDAHKTITSPRGIKETGTSSAKPITVGENHGTIYTNTGASDNPSSSGTGGSETGPGEPPAEPVSNPPDDGTGTGGGGETSNPVIDTDVNVNPDSGTVEADATVDTTGELEDKQILDADLDAQDVASTDTEVGSPSEITEQEILEGTDTTPSGTTDQTAAEEPATEESNPIVDADANVNPESGTVEADATVDTSGELEEKQILDADVTAGETASTETAVGSATDVTQSDTVESADITTQPVSTVTATSTLTAEVDTTGATTGGETDVGVEADVSGVSEGEDVTCDPADGLTSADCGVLKL